LNGAPMVAGGVERKPKNQKPICPVPTRQVSRSLCQAVKESRLIDQAHLWRPRRRTIRDRNYFPRGAGLTIPADHLGVSVRLRQRGSLWLNVQLLSERAPPILLLPDKLCGTFGCARALGREPERQQPFLDLGALEVLPDLTIEPRDHLCWRA